MDDLKTMFEKEGRVWFRGALSDQELGLLRRQFSDPSKPGKRHLTLDDGISRKLLALAKGLGLEVQIRGNALFNKNKDLSWTLPWHQDRTIAVSSRFDDPAYTRWSRKDGMWFCEPPLNALKSYCFAHILLDDVKTNSGPMEIAPASHQFGRITRDEIDAIVKKSKLELCTGEAGDILFLKYLTLHRSTRNQSHRSRIALRVDFGGERET